MPFISTLPPLVETHPELSSEIHPTENSNIVTTNLTAGSKKVLRWLGPCGHEWEAPIYRRALSNTGCPYCSGNKILAGFNDLATTHPAIAAEWDTKLNPAEASPAFVSKGSNRKYWWFDKLGHNWEASPGSRVRGTGCPYCSGNKILKGFNDLASVNPKFLNEWHVDNVITPDAVNVYSTHKALWLCSEGHEWKASVNERHHYNCPKCAKNNAGKTKKVPKPGADLASVYPAYAAEWHPTMNGTLLPTQVNAGTSQRIWWQCSKKHEWSKRVADRVFSKTGCPICIRSETTSKAEKELASFLRSLNLNVLPSDRSILQGKEIDIYLPDHKIGIEYNGLYWHSEGAGKGKKYHYDKWLQAKEAGVQLIQIWEDDWNRNPGLIKTMLAHKIGVSSSARIYARKTHVQEVHTSEAKTFYEAHYIQRFAPGTFYLALKDESENTVALLTLRQEKDNVYNILRYATSLTVVGGFTKLLHHAEKTYDIKQLITFADHATSNGALYEKNGFIAVKEICPDYMYVVKSQRKDKLGYPIKKFKNSPNLLWFEGLTERELAELNGIPRIWDAGKTKYVKHIR